MHCIYNNGNRHIEARSNESQKNGFSEWFLESQKQRNTAQAKKKNGEKCVVVVSTAGQSSIGPVADATSGVLTSPMDIPTEEIFGCGTKRTGLSYMDDIAPS
ncbi:unnamed protein product [Prunus armeniaca]